MPVFKPEGKAPISAIDIGGIGSIRSVGKSLLKWLLPAAIAGSAGYYLLQPDSKGQQPNIALPVPQPQRMNSALSQEDPLQHFFRRSGEVLREYGEQMTPYEIMTYLDTIGKMATMIKQSSMIDTYMKALNIQGKEQAIEKNRLAIQNQLQNMALMNPEAINRDVAYKLFGE